MNELLKICLLVTQEAGQLILDLSKQPRHIEKKAAFDLVTDADKAANALITRRLLEELPDSYVMSEEDPASHLLARHPGKVLWIVDPIDGTTNYARGIPHAAVSIAACDAQTHEPLLGCVYNPFVEECFWASKGDGAFLNGQRLQVSQTSEMRDAVVATGYFNDETLTYENSNLPETYAFIRQCLGIRRNGAASLDLCWLAAGRFDIYWEKGLHAWDIAAGALIAQEAGGQVSNHQGNPLDLFEGFTLASNGILHSHAITTLTSGQTTKTL